MIRGSFFEELDADVCGDFFDHIDDLLDFPNEDECPITGEGENPNLGGLWSTAHEDLKVSESAFSSGQGSSLTTEDDLAAGLSVPCEDLDQLEWLSTFVEDSFSAGNITLEEEGNNKDSQFRTSSPVSVLEGSSCTEKTLPLSPDTVVPGRARTKRPRPASFNTRLPVALISATSSTDTHTGPPLLSASDFPPELDDFAESRPHENFAKKKKKRPAPAAHQGVAHDRWAPPAHPVRKCMHCEIQKTPQWRAGPMGPKTLCNACGVRYKSGRLFPEYRPAASPTFISAVHSNSHKKVVEMRVKMGQKEPAPTPQFVRKSGGRSSGNHLLLDHNE